MEVATDAIGAALAYAITARRISPRAGFSPDLRLTHWGAGAGKLCRDVGIAGGYGESILADLS